MFPLRFSWIALFFWALSMLALSPYDQSLSRQLCSPNSHFARFVQDWAALPAYVAVSLALLMRFKEPTCLWARAILYQCLLHSLLLTHLLKQLWGRARPGDVLSQPELYTDFFVPLGPFLGESFPSGHVAATLVLAPLPFLYWRTERYLPCFLSSLALGALWLATCYGRVLFGVHFPTDCLFSLGSGLLSAYLIVSWLSSSQRTETESE